MAELNPEKLSESLEDWPIRKYRVRRRHHSASFVVEAQRLQMVSDTFVFLTNDRIRHTFHASEIAMIDELEEKPEAASYRGNIFVDLDEKMRAAINAGDIESARDLMLQMQELHRQ